MKGIDTLRHGGFELGVSGKNNYRNNVLRREKIQELSDYRYVTSVLLQRILESESGFVEDLGPFSVYRSREDPTGIVFGFYNEHTEARD